MPDREKVRKAIEDCVFHKNDCVDCDYDGCVFKHGDCRRDLLADALAMLKEQEEERKRMISWLGKFCRHIDNGDKWLSDEENIAFFKEKMKQQFGW